ncbi:dihydropyrimidinase-like [Quercus robur]|uniref:dihydropyrimidinase-like n=1 Tax=Quercus robur TaxID=38942 RepID=UPI0021617363|nr:dihydropyrimidinase-like [Quercus robur]
MSDLSDGLLQVGDDVTVLDATGKFVMPGGIDPHTHLAFEFMGTETVDDFFSGQAAALVGGTTMHIDFVIPVSGSLTAGFEAYEKKAKKSCMDYGFHMAITKWDEVVSKEVEIMVKEKGINSFKFFLAYKGALMINDELLLEGFKKCKSLGALAMVHAENGDAVYEGQKRMSYVRSSFVGTLHCFTNYINALGGQLIINYEYFLVKEVIKFRHGWDRVATVSQASLDHGKNEKNLFLPDSMDTDTLGFSLLSLEKFSLYDLTIIIPVQLEAEATARAIRLAGFVNTPLYVVHVMSIDAMEEIATARRKGQRVIGEPVVSGLALDESGVWDPDFVTAAKFVMSPPIRASGHDKALQAALSTGILQLVGTDHCSFNSTQKAVGIDDFRNIPNGVNGIEERMHMVWDIMVVSCNGFLAHSFKIISLRAILPGSDADIIIFNPNSSFEITAKSHHSRSDTNVYEGRRGKLMILFVAEKQARAMPLENSQTQSAAVYGADQSNYGYDTSQTYYQETAPSQMQPSVPSSPYGGNYQPPSSSPYGAYGTPAPYQPPNIFLPSQTPSQPNFAAPPVTAPVARPFIPTTPAMLKNAGQYQQPTLGSQLYPGTANPTCSLYHMGMFQLPLLHHNQAQFLAIHCHML